MEPSADRKELDEKTVEDIRPDYGTANSVIRFFIRNPWVGALGSLASIIGLLLAIYFYLQSVNHPDLVYYTNPVRTTIVKQGAASRLTVSVDGHPLSEDVTAAQIAIWNKGRRAIKPEIVLSPIVIKTNPVVPILEATVRTKSRDVVTVQIDKSHIDRGELPISWNILEQSDGAVLQLVYSSGPDVEIRCFGVLEDQPQIHELRYSGKIKSPAEQIAEDKWLKFVGMFSLFLAIAAIWYNFHMSKKYPGFNSGWSDKAFAVGFPLFLIGGWVYLTFIYSVPRPPFGFQ